MPALAALCGMLPGWIWALICAGLMAVNGVQMVRVSLAHGQVNTVKQQLAEERASFEKLKAEAAAQRARDESAARKREQTLQAAADKLRSQKDAEIQSLRADVRSLRDRLQQLPERPADATDTADRPAPEAAGAREAPSGYAGSVIYRDTGEALVSEAERADTIRLALIQCYSLWDQARSVNAPR
jgi:septal ring factor EnvC (AmiA/AmiB activator)